MKGSDGVGKGRSFLVRCIACWPVAVKEPANWFVVFVFKAGAFSQRIICARYLVFWLFVRFLHCIYVGHSHRTHDGGAGGHAGPLF